MHERDAPAGEREAFRERVQLDRHLPCALALEDRRRHVAVESEVRVREVVHQHELALAREVHEPLEHAEVGARRRRIVRKRAEQDPRPWLGREPRLLHTRHEVDVGPHGDAGDRGAREAGREEVDRIARARHERDVTRAEQHPQEVHEALLRSERQRRLSLRIQLDAVALAIQIADRFAELRQAAARGVAMVARQERCLAQLLDGDLRRRHVRVPEAEVDHVLAGTAELELEALDLGEGVRRECVDAPKLHGGHPKRGGP